jgi:oligopeptide/dipeptide ABC transporter ATP-binding protein
MTHMSSPVLEVRGLVVDFVTPEGVVHAVDGVSWDLYPGETLGIVGESGSGKSVSVLSLLRLIPSPPGRVVAGEAMFEGRDLLTLSKRELRELRGRDIAMIFQDPMTSLNPVFTVGRQIAEALLVHDRARSGGEARQRAVELLDAVGVPQPDVRYRQYPHEFSGGMRQRAMIAMAMANRPRVLIADEPTTALDVTIQAQVLDVLKAAQQETDAATILITHDLGLIAELADRVIVMYAGQIVEMGDVRTIFHEPRHPYTFGLMASLPRLDIDTAVLPTIPGQPPSLIRRPPGCPFHPRCRLSRERALCRDETPVPVETTIGHISACHFHDEMAGLIEEVATAVGTDVTKGLE